MIDVNGARFEPSSEVGHYESWFQRANHPSEKRAFWIRYTIFCPKGRPADAVGELWAIHFDGDQIVAVKEVHPIAECSFASRGLDVKVAGATLDGGGLKGRCVHDNNMIEWDLKYASNSAPLLLFSEKLYSAPLPKAKALVGSPLACFDGHVDINGVRVDIDGWVGSQNHNWGSKHTDEYAWGQVAGFDEAPDAFLELSTARIHLGPFKTPWMTPLVLRYGGRELRFSALLRAARNDGAYDTDALRWTFSASDGDEKVSGTIYADRGDFVGLPYDNPPGGRKTCLNSKVAHCDLLVRTGGSEKRLTSKRAAFEILTERTDHGIAVLNA